MAITRGQPSNLYASGSVSPTSNACTWPVNPTARSKIVLWVYNGISDIGVPTSVVDNGTTATNFQLVASETSNSSKAWMYYADFIVLPASGAYTVTVTFSATGTDVEVFGMEVIGAGWGAAQDSWHGWDSTLNYSTVTGAVGAGEGNYYAALMSLPGAGVPRGITTEAPFTQQAVQQNGGTHQAGAMADYIGDGPQSCGWDWTLTAQYSATIIACWPPAPDPSLSAPGEGFARSQPHA